MAPRYTCTGTASLYERLQQRRACEPPLTISVWPYGPVARAKWDRWQTPHARARLFSRCGSQFGDISSAWAAAHPGVALLPPRDPDEVARDRGRFLAWLQRRRSFRW